MPFPEYINTVEELEEVLTTPSEALIASLGELTGGLMVLGAGGKMGVSLAILAKRAIDWGGLSKRIVAVSRFSNPAARTSLTATGVETIACDLFNMVHLNRLPEMENIVYMVGQKFGTAGREWSTWAINAYLPGVVANRFRHSRLVLFSSGNVYPFCKFESGGCRESDPPAPVGEYAQSVLARERVFEYFSRTCAIPGMIIRLNYAIDLRYGVLLDVAQKVFSRQKIDLTMGYVNVIWQGDANAFILRSLGLADIPPNILNVTGNQTLSIRDLALQFGEKFGKEPIFTGKEADTALLSNAEQCHRLFGPPAVSLSDMIRWTAHWVKIGGFNLGKPTQYEMREGKFY